MTDTRCTATLIIHKATKIYRVSHFFTSEPSHLRSNSLCNIFFICFKLYHSLGAATIFFIFIITAAVKYYNFYGINPVSPSILPLVFPSPRPSLSPLTPLSPLHITSLLLSLPPLLSSPLPPPSVLYSQLVVLESICRF